MILQLLTLQIPMKISTKPIITPSSRCAIDADAIHIRGISLAQGGPPKTHVFLRWKNSTYFRVKKKKVKFETPAYFWPFIGVNSLLLCLMLGKNMLLNGGVSWRFRNNVAPWQFYVCDLFGMAVSSRDPNSRVVGDLPRSGIKRSRIESPGCFLFMLFLFVFLVRIFLGKATWFFQTFRKDDSKIQTDDRVWLILYSNRRFFALYHKKKLSILGIQQLQPLTQPSSKCTRTEQSRWPSKRDIGSQHLQIMGT